MINADTSKEESPKVTNGSCSDSSITPKDGEHNLKPHKITVLHFPMFCTLPQHLILCVKVYCRLSTFMLDLGLYTIMHMFKLLEVGCTVTYVYLYYILVVRH